MAVEGDIVIAEITAVVAQRESVLTPKGHTLASPGYVTVLSPWGHQTLMNGSIQGIPEKHRVGGKRIRLRWGKAGGYHGPMFAGIPDDA